VVVRQHCLSLFSNLSSASRSLTSRSAAARSSSSSRVRYRLGPSATFAIVPFRRASSEADVIEISCRPDLTKEGNAEFIPVSDPPSEIETVLAHRGREGVGIEKGDKDVKLLPSGFFRARDVRQICDRDIEFFRGDLVETGGSGRKGAPSCCQRPNRDPPNESCMPRDLENSIVMKTDRHS
jgi:hypothetical protein